MNSLIHIIQNDPDVPPGTILENLTVPYTVLRPYDGDPLPAAGDLSALIVLGGAMGANDDERHPFLTGLKQLIRSAVASRVPYLGVCLGGQLLATALGAEVVSSRWGELGTLPVSLTESGENDLLFTGIEHEFMTFQWHHDSFDIPAGGVVLASSTACTNQAFRVGDTAWGLQFHPEVTEAIIRDWCAWDPATASRVEELVIAFSHASRSYERTAHLLVRNFMHAARL